jgi:signal transduction histidine kinase
VKLGFESIALVPVHCEGAVRGLLMLYDVRPGRLAPGDVAFLEGLAASIGTALARHYSEQALLQNIERVQAMREVDEAILSARSLSRIAEAALTHVPKLFGCRRACVHQFNMETEQAIILASFDEKEKGASSFASKQYALDDLGQINDLRKGKMRVTKDIDALTAKTELDRFARKLGLRSYVMAPLVAGGELIGILNLFSEQVDAFSAGSLEAARELAECLALGIEHTRLHEEIKRRADELEERVAERTQELKEINAELESFSYSISHDLRAPLRGISGYSGVLLEDYSDKLDEDGRRLLSSVKSSTEYLGQLIKGLLEFSRVSRQELQLVNVDMTELAKVAYRQVWAQEEEEGQPRGKLEFDVKTLPGARGDPLMLRQVFVNLFGNALKFSRKKDCATVEVGGNVGRDECTYYVKDSGVGFKMENAHKMFGVFKRLHKKGEFEGTGVGLAIVQRIIHRHGGRIWAQGSPGEGATVYFTLPQPAKEDEDGRV